MKNDQINGLLQNAMKILRCFSSSDQYCITGFLTKTVLYRTDKYS